MWRGLSGRGFTLMEVLVGMLFVLAAGMLLPSFSMNLVIGDNLWERRVAMRVIENQLDNLCAQATTSAGFDGIGTLAPTAIAELTAGTREQVVNSVNGEDFGAGANLKQVVVTVKWTSRNRPGLRVDSANYLISRTGLCG